MFHELLTAENLQVLGESKLASGGLSIQASICCFCVGVGGRLGGGAYRIHLAVILVGV